MKLEDKRFLGLLQDQNTVNRGLGTCVLLCFSNIRYSTQNNRLGN